MEPLGRRDVLRQMTAATVVALEGLLCDEVLGNLVHALWGGTRPLEGREHPSSQHLLELLEANIHLSLDD